MDEISKSASGQSGKCLVLTKISRNPWSQDEPKEWSCEKATRSNSGCELLEVNLVLTRKTQVDLPAFSIQTQ